MARPGIAAKAAKSFQIDTPLGKSPTIYRLPRYGDVGSDEIVSASEQFPGQRIVQLWVTLMALGVEDVIHGNINGGLADKAAALLCCRPGGLAIRQSIPAG